MSNYYQSRTNSAALAALMDSLALGAPVACPPVPEPTQAAKGATRPQAGEARVFHSALPGTEGAQGNSA